MRARTGRRGEGRRSPGASVHAAQQVPGEVDGGVGHDADVLEVEVVEEVAVSGQLLAREDQTLQLSRNADYFTDLLAKKEKVELCAPLVLEV
jgi:hypothetical protein